MCRELPAERIELGRLVLAARVVGLVGDQDGRLLGPTQPIGNLVVERRFAMGRLDRLQDLAAELVRLGLDVIVTGGNPTIAAVRQATSTIPVVMGTSREPVASGFVASLGRPGGNITGLTGDPSADIQGKRLELLMQVAPNARRVAALWNPVPPGAQTAREAIEDASRKLGISLHVVPIRSRDELEAAFMTIVQQRSDALLVVPDPLTFTARGRVVDLAARHRLPAVYHAREIVEIGGLMSYGASLTDQFRRAAGYVDRILKGAKPAELPVEQPTKFELVVNLQTARTLGLTIPQAVLARADAVIR